MKKFIIISFLLLFGITSQSQVLISLLLGDKLNSDGLEFGLEGGANMAGISGFDSFTGDVYFNLGFYFDFRIKNQWHLYTGVLVKSNLGAANLSEDDISFLNRDVFIETVKDATQGYDISEDFRFKQKMKTFLIPALIKYRFKNNFYIEMGPQIGLRFKAWLEYEHKSKEEEVRIREYNKDDIKRIEGGLVAGLGYKLPKKNGMSFGLKYYQGLVNVYKVQYGYRTNSLNLKVNIPIGANKSKDKK
jgi:hypothetical protein